MRLPVTSRTQEFVFGSLSLVLLLFFFLFYTGKTNTNMQTSSWSQDKERKLQRRHKEEDGLCAVFPSGRSGRLSVPIPEVREEFTEHGVNFQK